jgi:hypothetical protein
MDYTKYNNPVQQPKTPSRPVHPKPAASAQEFRNYADKLDQYEKEMVKYREAKEKWQDKESDRYEQFRIDALDEAGLTGNPAADRAYSYAYQRGRDGGMSDIMLFLEEIAEVILGGGTNSITPIVPNPMREKVLARIAEFKKEHNGFSRSSMRWKLVTFGVTVIGDNSKYGKSEVGTHISNVNFAGLSDDDLLDVFEKIIRRHYVQM